MYGGTSSMPRGLVGSGDHGSRHGPVFYLFVLVYIYTSWNFYWSSQTMNAGNTFLGLPYRVRTPSPTGRRRCIRSSPERLARSTALQGVVWTIRDIYTARTGGNSYEHRTQLTVLIFGTMVLSSSWAPVAFACGVTGISSPPSFRGFCRQRRADTDLRPDDQLSTRRHPAFHLDGEYPGTERIIEDIYHMVYHWLGWLKGGVAQPPSPACTMMRAMAGVVGPQR